MVLIKDYYSDKVYKLIETLLGLKSNVPEVEKQIKAIPRTEFLDDPQNYVDITAEEKVNDFFMKSNKFYDYIHKKTI